MAKAQRIPAKGQGRGIAFLREHVSHQGDECLIWPMSRLTHTGYGMLGFEGKSYFAHRLMCTMAHGEPPTENHQAAHLCGNGHLGCVNPKHLEWKTRSENHLDRRGHGTAKTSPYGRYGKLTSDDRARIVALRKTHTLLQIAPMFGVSFQTIWRVHRDARREDAKRAD